MASSSREAPIEIDLNAREKRVYDRLRSRLVTREPGERSGIWELALLLPDLGVLLARLSIDRRVPIGGKAIAAIGLAYVLSPIDLMPEILLGPFGALDDLVIAAACLSRILNYVPVDLVRSHWSGQEDILAIVQRVTGWSESLITERIPAALRRLIGG